MSALRRARQARLLPRLLYKSQTIWYQLTSSYLLVHKDCAQSYLQGFSYAQLPAGSRCSCFPASQIPGRWQISTFRLRFAHKKNDYATLCTVMGDLTLVEQVGNSVPSAACTSEEEKISDSDYSSEKLYRFYYLLEMF